VAAFLVQDNQAAVGGYLGECMKQQKAAIEALEEG